MKDHAIVEAYLFTFADVLRRKTFNCSVFVNGCREVYRYFVEQAVLTKNSNHIKTNRPRESPLLPLQTKNVPRLLNQLHMKVASRW